MRGFGCFKAGEGIPGERTPGAVLAAPFGRRVVWSTQRTQGTGKSPLFTRFSRGEPASAPCCRRANRYRKNAAWERG
jgi:hypothetical protein